MVVNPSGATGGINPLASMGGNAGKPISQAKFDSLKLNITLRYLAKNKSPRSEYATFAGMRLGDQTQITPRQLANVLREGASNQNAVITIQLPNRLPNGDVETVTIDPADPDLASKLTRITGFNWAGAKNIFGEQNLSAAKPSAKGGSPAEISRGTGMSQQNNVITNRDLGGIVVGYQGADCEICTRNLSMGDLGVFTSGATLTVDDMAGRLQALATRVGYTVNVRLPNGVNFEISPNIRPNIAPSLSFKPEIQAWANTLPSSSGSPTEQARGTGGAEASSAYGEFTFVQPNVKPISDAFKAHLNRSMGEKVADAAGTLLKFIKRS